MEIDTQNRIRKLNRITNIHNKISERYNKIGEEFKRCLDVMKDDNLFSRNKLGPYVKRQGIGKAVLKMQMQQFKNKVVWCTEGNRNPDIRGKIEDVKVRLRWAFEVIKAMDKVEYRVNEELEKKLAEGEQIDKEMIVHTHFHSLRDIMRRFSRLRKEIKDQNLRRKLVKDIRAEFKILSKKMGKDVALIYSGDIVRLVYKMHENFERLGGENRKLVGMGNKLFKLTEHEEMVVRFLARELRNNMIKFNKTLNYYGVDIKNSRFVDGLKHFETNLDKREQEIIIGEVTPLILALDDAAKKLVELLGKENIEITMLGGFIDHLKNVRRGEKLPGGIDKISNEDRRKFVADLLKSVRSLEEGVMKKEPELMKRMEKLQDDIKRAFRNIRNIEDKRDGIKSRLELVEGEGIILGEGNHLRQPLNLPRPVPKEKRERWYKKVFRRRERYEPPRKGEALGGDVGPGPILVR